MIQHKKSYPWIIWILTAGFFFAEYFARVSPSVMVPELMRAFQVNAFKLGSLSAFFYYAYVSMQIPVGALVDRFGPRLLLSVMAALCGFSCLLFSWTHSLGVAELSRFLMGFSAAFAFVGALKLASIWFAPSRFGFIAGATQALGMLGAAVGEGPVSVLVHHIGWRDTLQLIAIVLLALSLLIVLIVRDNPKNWQAKEKTVRQFSMLSGLIKVLKTPQTWVNGIIVGFLYAPTAAFAELWGANYLHHVHHIGAEVAATAVGMIFIGWAIGSPIAGWISDRIQRRKPIIMTSIVLSAVMLSITLYMPNISETALFVLLFLYGLFNVGVATSYAVAAEIIPRNIAGTSMSFANMASVLIGACFQPIIGKILDSLWSGQMQNGIAVYSSHDYQMAMLTLPLCFVISLIASYFLKESFSNKPS
ncbi:MAG: MFS transporter [Gammaproteobacteria bacterium]|nr:MFS transporter [Gammaproteobacteria bacterium]